MSQVSKKVKWCLNKAKRELEETGLHRGLVKGEPNINLSEKHIVKAEHNLNAALYFENGGYSDWSASAFFYCLYHCFLAILRKYGYESRNQECTLAVIESLKEEGEIDIDSRFIDTLKITKVKETDPCLIRMREDFQYGVELDFKRKDEFDRLGVHPWKYTIRKVLKEGFSIVVEGMYTNKIKDKSVTERVFQIGKMYKVKTFVFDLLADIDTIIYRATKLRKAESDLIPEAYLDLKKSHKEFMSKLYTKAIQIETKGKTIKQITNEMLKIVRER